jgi:hypothetical protein
MRAASKSPSYLVRNPYSYCFRLIVPKDLQQLVGKRELRYSLRTGYLGVTKYKARLLAGQVQKLFKYLREAPSALLMLSDEKIQILVKKYIEDHLESLESCYYDSQNPGVQSYDEYYERIGQLDFYRDLVIGYLGIGDYDAYDKIIADFLEKNGV